MSWWVRKILIWSLFEHTFLFKAGMLVRSLCAWCGSWSLGLLSPVCPDFLLWSHWALHAGALRPKLGRVFRGTWIIDTTNAKFRFIFVDGFLHKIACMMWVLVPLCKTRMQDLPEDIWLTILEKFSSVTLASELSLVSKLFKSYVDKLLSQTIIVKVLLFSLLSFYLCKNRNVMSILLQPWQTAISLSKLLEPSFYSQNQADTMRISSSTPNSVWASTSSNLLTHNKPMFLAVLFESNESPMKKALWDLQDQATDLHKTLSYSGQLQTTFSLEQCCTIDDIRAWGKPECSLQPLIFSKTRKFGQPSIKNHFLVQESDTYKYTPWPEHVRMDLKIPKFLHIFLSERSSSLQIFVLDAGIGNLGSFADRYYGHPLWMSLSRSTKFIF